MRLMLGLVVTSIFLLLPPQNAHGQESPITAGVNKTNLLTDELVILTVVVVDDSAQQPRPLLPRLEGLTVIDLDISTEVSIVNNQIHTEVTYVYRLQPRRTGLLTIPPVAVKIDEQVFKTPPISINVTQGAAPAPSLGNEAQPDNIIPPQNLEGQDFFVESLVDLPRPYVSQQIIHTFRFYQAIQLYQEPQYEGPRFTGFETMGLPVRQYNFNIAGRTYLVTEIRTALFPKNSGKTIIRPARLVLLGNFHEAPVEFYTDPIAVEVKSLPDDAPLGFNGAVGQFEIQAWFNSPTIPIHQPASLYVSVSGAGNIHSLPEPTWPELNNWRVYDTFSSLTADTQGEGLIRGTHVFERLVVPDEIGDTLIPSITLVYFDPIAADYRTIVTEPLPVKVTAEPTPTPVTPTTIAALPTATPVGMTVNPDQSLAIVDDQVNPISLGLLDIRRSLILPAIFVLLVGVCSMIPIAAVAGAGGLWLWQQRRWTSMDRTEVDPPLQQPSQTIHPLLAAAMKKDDDNYKAVNQALNTYLETALKTPVIGLTRTKLARYLREGGLDERLVERIQHCLAESEVGRYGPITEDAGWSLMAETDELLFSLDEVFGKTSSKG